MSLQEALKLLRLELGLTQEDLAKKLNKTYVTVNRWENGKGFPTRNNARNILAAARRMRASEDCIAYLNEVLLPETKRAASAASYGFPDADRDFLIRLADDSVNAVYVIEAGTYALLYANRKAERMAERYRREIPAGKDGEPVEGGRRCYRYFGGRAVPCPFCPLLHADSVGVHDAVVQIPETGRVLRVHVKPWELHGRRAYALYLTDVTQEHAERNALYALTNEIPVGAGICQVYLDDRIGMEYMNRPLRQMLGEEAAEALLRGEHPEPGLLHTDDRSRLAAEIRQSLAEKRDVSLDLRLRRQDGKCRRLHLDAHLMRKGKEWLTYACLLRETGAETEQAAMETRKPAKNGAAGGGETEK